MFYKEKGFYISLLCGVAALAAFGVICFRLMGNENSEGDGVQYVAEESAEPVQTKEPEAEPASADKAEKVKEKEEQKDREKKKNKSVETGAAPVSESLHFDEENGLLWPVKGEILMEYCADSVVYFKTLAQYRANPAVLIAAKEGDDVKASADGIVKEITTSEETGRTLRMDIGGDYSVTYGQLKEVSVGVGDRVEEGEVIGKVAAPTKYYSLEGTNLYYQVKQKETTVNPMILLR